MFQDGLPRSIPSESLFLFKHLTGSPAMVTVHPSSHLCASLSTQTISTGTTLTAGIQCVLSLHARDSFGNDLSVESISNNNVFATFVRQLTEQPRFSYSSFSGNINVSFALTKKRFYYIQWFVRGVGINQAFSIEVIPNSPDFSSISPIGTFPQHATAGFYFQHALAVFDNFGNMRSFLEKEQDFSRNIQAAFNVSSEAFQYNATLCRRDTEYVLFKKSNIRNSYFNFRCSAYGVSGSSIFAGDVALFSAVVTVSGGISIKFGFNFSDINLVFWSRAVDMTVSPASVCATKSSVIRSHVEIYVNERDISVMCRSSVLV